MDLLGRNGTAINSAELDLEHQPVPADQVLAGSPTTADVVLGQPAQSEFGVWEMTPGVMTDTEIDEVFIVVSGSATVDIEPWDGDPARSLNLRPGDVVQLHAGMRTVWTVTQTFRKIYVTVG